MNKFDELASVLNRKSINISQAPWLSACLGLLLAVPAPRLRAGTTPGSLTFSDTPLLRSQEGGSEPAIALAGNGTMATKTKNSDIEQG
jgi:hypothetical protein